MKKYKNKKAEGYVDSGVKILIAVVIGALLLAGLYTLFNTTIMPSVSDKVESLFGYTGNSGKVNASSNGVEIVNCDEFFEEDENYSFYLNTDDIEIKEVYLDGEKTVWISDSKSSGGKTTIVISYMKVNELSKGNHTITVDTNKGEINFEKTKN